MLKKREKLPLELTGIALVGVSFCPEIFHPYSQWCRHELAVENLEPGS